MTGTGTGPKSKTIEQPMLEMQDKKKAMGDGSMRALNPVEMATSRMDNIKLLFDIQ